MSHYKYTNAHPPRLSDEGGDVLDIPLSVRTTDLGTSSYILNNVRFIDPGNIIEVLHRVKCTLTHKRCWKIFQSPVHYAEDTVVQIEDIRGYSESQKHTFESKMGMTFSDLSPTIQAETKITDEVTREWHAQHKESHAMTFKRDVTYVGWILVDSLHLQRDIFLLPIDFPGLKDVYRFLRAEHDVFDVVSSTYFDHAADPQRQLFEKANALRI
jgi:hypothetical protein